MPHFLYVDYTSFKRHWSHIFAKASHYFRENSTNTRKGMISSSYSVYHSTSLLCFCSQIIIVFFWYSQNRISIPWKNKKWSWWSQPHIEFNIHLSTLREERIFKMKLNLMAEILIGLTWLHASGISAGIWQVSCLERAVFHQSFDLKVFPPFSQLPPRFVPNKSEHGKSFQHFEGTERSRLH